MKTRKLLLTGLCALVLGTTSCSKKTLTTLKTEGVLVVGMECAYAPFNWTEPTASETNVVIENIPDAYAEGYDVQVARIIAEELDLELKIKALDFSALINNLDAGEIDLIIAGMSPTAERMKKIDFTNKYYESTHVMLVKADSKYANATSLDDFAGAKVIGQTGTIYADLVPQTVEHGAVAGTNLDTVPAIVNAIKEGAVDATILEEPVAKGIMRQQPGLTYVTFEEGKGFVVSDDDKIVSIGVRKGFELTDEINDILDTILTENKRVELMEQATLMAPVQEDGE